MAYSPTTWVDNETVVSATRMNNIEAGISAAYVKPSSGIPAADLASGVVPTVHNVPSGGSENQVLAKNSGTDYDLKWVNQSGGGGATISVSNTTLTITT